MRAMKACSSISSSSRTSIARRVLPPRLELNRPVGSSSRAPLKNVSFTTLLYVSPVQIGPRSDHTGTPGFEGFLHFHSSTTSGSACLIRARSLERVWPRQSPSSLILNSINCEGDSTSSAELLVMRGDVTGQAVDQAGFRRRGGEYRQSHEARHPDRLL